MSKNVLAELVTKMTIESSQFKKELEKTTAKTHAWGKAQQQSANDSVYANKRLADSFDKTNKAASRFKSTGLANIGYQLQDMSVQAQMGTNSLIIMGQQIPQLLGGFGAMGAIAGTFVAIGAAATMAMNPQLGDSENAVSDLADSMERLRDIATKSDNGLYEFTDAIRELSKVGASVVGAELEASLIRSERAAKQAASSITETFSDIGAGYGFSDISDYVSALNNELVSGTSYTKGFINTATDLGEEFGKTGVEAKTLGAEIIYALAELQKTPTADKFEALQKRLADLASSGEDVSAKAKLMVSDLALFFAEARSAAETASFIQTQLDKLNESGQVDLSVDDVALSHAQSAIQSIAEQVSVARAELEGSDTEARKLQAAFEFGVSTFEQMPEPAQALYELLFKIEEQQKKNNESHKEYLKQQREAEAQAETESKLLANLRAQVIGYEEGAKAAHEYNIAQQLGLESISQIPPKIQEQIDKLYLLKEAQEVLQEENYWERLREEVGTTAEFFTETWEGAFDTFASGLGQATASALMEQQNFSDALDVIAKGVISSVIQGLVQIGVQKLALWALESTIIGSSTAARTAAITTEAAAASTAWATPAALASLASFGANSAPAMAGIASTVGFSQGLSLAGAREYGGPVESGRTYLVGEKGPELFTPRYSGDITSNKDLMSNEASAEPVNPIVNQFNIQAMDASTFEAFIRDKGESVAKSMTRYQRR